MSQPVVIASPRVRVVTDKNGERHYGIGFPKAVVDSRFPGITEAQRLNICVHADLPGFLLLEVPPIK